MTIPTEPIGSIPRPLRLLEALETTDSDDPSLEPLRDNIKPGQQVFVGVVSPINPRIETVEEIRDAVLEASKYLPADQLGTTDDCGYSPFCDDNSITRETAFEKIRRRVEGTELAARQIGGN